jgi:FlaA1/EpsC-like NDP-sugar epimerase
LIGELVTGTEHPKIMRAKEETLSWGELEILLSKLELACKQIDLKKIRKLLMEAVVGFEPKDEVSDPQWEGREEQSLPTQEQSPKITPLFKS